MTKGNLFGNLLNSRTHLINFRKIIMKLLNIKPDSAGVSANSILDALVVQK